MGHLSLVALRLRMAEARAVLGSHLAREAAGSLYLKIVQMAATALIMIAPSYVHWGQKSMVSISMHLRWLCCSPCRAKLDI